MSFHSKSQLLIRFTAIVILVCLSYNLSPQRLLPVYIEKARQAETLSAQGKFSEARHCYAEALKLAREEDNLHQQAILNAEIGNTLAMQGIQGEATRYFRISYALAEEISDSTLIGNALDHLGKSHEYAGNYDSAFLYFQNTLRIREFLADTAGLADSYHNMAQILRVLRRLPEARHYCRMALSLTDDTTPFKTIARIFNETAYLYELDNILDSARFFYEKLIDISTANNYYQGISVGYSNLASVFEHEGNFTEALRLKKEGLEMDKRLNDINGVTTSYLGIADCHIKMGDFSKSLAYLDSAAMICDTAWIGVRQGIEQFRYLAHRGLGNYRNALEHFEESVALKDSLFNETKRKNIAEILTRYETEKKVQQIELLNKTNEIRSQKIRSQRFLLLGILLLSIAGAIISTLVIKRKNDRISRMVLEMKNYMLMLKENRPSQNNHPPTGSERIELLMVQFRFTRREAEIMDLIMDGLTNEEIAERLFVSLNTVKFHIKNIYMKLDVKNRIQALRKASAEENTTG